MSQNISELVCDICHKAPATHIVGYYNDHISSCTECLEACVTPLEKLRCDYETPADGDKRWCCSAKATRFVQFLNLSRDFVCDKHAKNYDREEKD